MKRLLCLLIACLLILPACAADPEPALDEMLGVLENEVYTSAFGYSIDLTDLHTNTREQLYTLTHPGEEFSPEVLMEEMRQGKATAILSASNNQGFNSLILSLIPVSEMPRTIRDAGDYAEYSMTVVPDTYAEYGYTDIRTELTSVTLEGVEHPAIHCSCLGYDGSPYYLLQVFFHRGDWMSSMSITSLESEDVLWEFWNRVFAS